MPSSTAATSPVDAPAALRVECDGTRTEVSAPLVRTQPDGVHIEYVNTDTSVPYDYMLTAYLAKRKHLG
jgi:hypothetical protein